MIRGKTLFKCTTCKNRFVGLDIEFMGTAFSQPLPCPRCKSIRTRPSRLVGGFNFMYKPIWEKMSEKK